MGAPRDYYADLELPPNADVADIKKQFRKLALKYHPDRNPGKEQEVNAKFQVIQTANEILTDPHEKAKYDATLGRARGPTASGVRGNPWSHVSQQFPTPPRRNQPPRSAASGGAQRWQRFSNGVPPTAKQHTSAESEAAKKNAAKAFEGMRRGQAHSAGRPPQPPPRESRPGPPPPPRTESARQRAQASFGNRKTSHHAQPPMPADEPPAASHSYNTRPSQSRNQEQSAFRRKPTAAPMPDPLRQFRDPDDSDERQRTPYTTGGGEKTNPFDGVPLSRAKSTREAAPQPGDSSEYSTKDHAHRSSSVPRNASAGEPDLEVPGGGRKPRRPEEPNNPTADGGSQANPSANTFHNADSSEPSMYAKFNYPQPNFPITSSYTMRPSLFQQGWKWHFTSENTAPHTPSNTQHQHVSPSGDQPKSHEKPVHFEQQLNNLLDHLIANSAEKEKKHEKRHNTENTTPRVTDHGNFANAQNHNRFNFNVDDDTFARSSAETHRFGRSSVDNINTKFANEGETSTWAFNAGSEQSQETPGIGTRKRADARRSPTMSRVTRQASKSNPDLQSERSEGAFNADGWSDKFGPQVFEHRKDSGSTASPTKASRTNSRKTKPGRPTAGTAAVIDDSSEEDGYSWTGRKGTGKPVTVDSPQAMDIDSPPPEPAGRDPSSNGARNIPVEPSRPEWRSGNFDTSSAHVRTNADINAEKPEPKPFNPNAAGSEDSEEFRASLADLKNVAPFAQPSTGLKSFSDLKDNLPFESKASGDVPVKLPKAPTLVFPEPPQAPKLPPTVAVRAVKPTQLSWDKYLAEFTSYLERWDHFNAEVVDHFATRKSNVAHQRELKGYSFLAARADADVQNYFSWVQQDKEVRRRWTEACEEHERQFQAFLAFRERMK